MKESKTNLYNATTKRLQALANFIHTYALLIDENKDNPNILNLLSIKLAKANQALEIENDLERLEQGLKEIQSK